MILQLTDIGLNETKQLLEALESRMQDNEVKLVFAPHFTPESWLVHEQLDHIYPSQRVITYVSYSNDNDLLGVVQAYIQFSHDGIISCTDVSVLSLGNKSVTFIRDINSIYDFLYGFCHRIEVTGIIPTFGDPNGNAAYAKYKERCSHFRKYNPVKVGQRNYVTSNALGQICHEVIWEIITDKGLLDFKNKE